MPVEIAVAVSEPVAAFVVGCVAHGRETPCLFHGTRAVCAQEAVLLIRDDGDDNYSAEITIDSEAVSRARMAFTDYEYKQL